MISAVDDDDDDDITKCCKCRQLLTDPRTLPCLDSLCGKCFTEVCHSYSDNLAGMAACPRCDDQFPLPDGSQALPDHGFIDTLVALKKIANENMEDDNCDICKHLSSSSEPVAAAEYYCIECRQRTCAGCARRHTLWPLTKNHNIVGLGLDSAREVLDKLKSYIPGCANHKDINATVHCYQCRIGLCSQCQNMHSSHELELMTDDSYSKMTRTVKYLCDQLHQLFDACNDKTDRAQKLLDVRRTGVAGAEKEINDKADEIISLIQKQRDELLKVLHSRNDQTISNIDTVGKRLLSTSVSSQKALRFAEELLEKGSVEDMLLNHRMLTERVTGLCNMSAGSSVLDDSDFSPASLIHDLCNSLNAHSKYCCVLTVLLFMCFTIHH